jgi:hypothetical protein
MPCNRFYFFVSFDNYFKYKNILTTIKGYTITVHEAQVLFLLSNASIYLNFDMCKFLNSWNSMG